jgi:hypothetical protein
MTAGRRSRRMSKRRAEATLSAELWTSPIDGLLIAGRIEWMRL